jgi:hypothetical protein
MARYRTQWLIALLTRPRTLGGPIALADPAKHPSARPGRRG